MTIAAFATGCEHGYVYLRGEYPQAHSTCSRTRSPRPARTASSATTCSGTGVDFDIELRQGRRRVHLRRGDRDLRVDRGVSRRAAQQAAVPGRGRACSASRLSSTTSRRSSTSSRSCSARARRSPSVGTEASTGTKLFCLSGHVERPGHVRGRRSGRRCASCSSSPAACPAGGRCRRCSLGGAAGSFVGARRARRAADLRGCARGGHDARLGGRPRARRDRRPAAVPDAHRGVLPQRVVRSVRPVPRRDGAPAGGARAPRRRGGRAVASARSSR